MHYKNGRPAKNGDKVLLRRSYGPPVIGILYNAQAGNNDCNGNLATCTQADPCPDLKECLHVDDIREASWCGLCGPEAQGALNHPPVDNAHVSPGCETFDQNLPNPTNTKPVFDILHQRQPTGKTCTQTCIAMCLGVPVEQVIKYYGEEAMNQELLTKALTECGVIWNQFTHGSMLYQGWYFAVAPSLNDRGINHQILVRWTEGDGLTVVDPAVGDTYKQDGSDLKSCAYLTPFMPGGTLPVDNVSSQPAVVADVIRKSGYTADAIIAMRRQGTLPPELDAQLKAADAAQKAADSKAFKADSGL